MSIVVVIALELVDIEHEQAEGCAAAARPSPLVFEAFVKGASVRQAGQAVTRGKGLEQVGLALEFEVRADTRLDDRQVKGLDDVIGRATLLDAPRGLQAIDPRELPGP